MLSYNEATSAVNEAEALIQDFKRWVSEWEAACLSGIRLKMSTLDYECQSDGRGGAVMDTSVLLEGMACIEMAASNMIYTYKTNVEKAYGVEDAEDDLHHHEDADLNTTWYASRGC